MRHIQEEKQKSIFTAVIQEVRKNKRQTGLVGVIEEDLDEVFPLSQRKGALGRLLSRALGRESPSILPSVGEVLSVS